MRTSLVYTCPCVCQGELLDGDDDIQGRRRGTVLTAQVEEDMETPQAICDHEVLAIHTE